MPRKPSSRGPPIRNSEVKLYQACLDACIEGIEKLPVSIRRTSVLPVTVEFDDVNRNNTTSTETASSSPPPLVTLNFRTTSPPTLPEPAQALPPPPPVSRSSSSLDSLPPDPAMNRAPLHGAPVPPHLRGRGRAQPAPSAYSSQDSRSNLAVQPAAPTGASFKLKKSAVKIVGAAAPAPPPSTPQRAPAPVTPSPRAAPVQAKAKEDERLEPAIPPAKSFQPVQPKVEPASPKAAPVSTELDDMFARLTTGTLSSTSTTTKASTPSRPLKSEFTFGDSPKDEASPIPKITATDLPASSIKMSLPTTVAQVQVPEQLVKDAVVKSTEQKQEYSQGDLEQMYVRKSSNYLGALSGVKNGSVQMIKTVSAKIRSTYSSDSKLSTEEADKLKAWFAFAIVNYVNNILKHTVKPISFDTVKKDIENCEGNMLALYGLLVDKGHLKLDSIDDVVALVKMIQNVLPKAEPVAAPLSQTQPSTETKAETKAETTKGTADGFKGWPTQEKRENPAKHRACILKGVSGVKSINELQALVWGGRLESINMPAPGADFAVVRFLTPEGCEKYFNATQNGIEMQVDTKKRIVFVEKQPGPTSINDNIQNCIDGGVTRCVRAMDAEEDWSDFVLMRLARGKGSVKREVDCIKCGKNARDRYFIDFRFAVIYDALNFRRALMEDSEWESCTVTYAPDPCDTAQGVHYNDADEQGAGFFT